MPQNQFPLGNSSNDVTITVAEADNQISIFLNPDISTVKGAMTVYENTNFGAAAINATLNLSGMLTAFKHANPSAKSVVLAIIMSNYAAQGQFNYKITGAGINLPTQTPNIPSWFSMMDSYIVYLH